MKNFSLIASTLLLVACGSEPENTEPKETAISATAISYPETRKDDVVDEYFGQKVADPYRWLEDDRSDETAAWVEAQNKVTFGYLDQIPYRESLKKRLTELWNYEKYSAPFTEGEYTYFYKNDGLQNQYVVYRQQGDGEAEVFLDPNKFSDDGTTSLAQLSFSKDGSIAAYAISEGGSDWRKVIIIDAKTKERLEPALENIKFSGISWKGNEGFFYSSYDKPEGSELSAKTDQHKLYYHKLGTAQSEDKVIFGESTEQKRRYVGGQVSEDGRFLLISGAQSTSGNDLHLLDLTQPDAYLKTIVSDNTADTNMLDSDGDTLYLVTNMDAPNQKVMAMDVTDPAPAQWKTVIPESENVLKASAGGGFIYAHYMVDATTKLVQFDRQGNKLRDIQLPDVGTASGLNGKPDDKVLYYSFTNYKTPSTIYSFDVDNGGSAVHQASGAQFNSDDYVSKQVFYTSKDGTKVPMIITHKKGVELNGKNPTILYGYGGFNISLTPSFSVANGVWLEQGGVYAVANMRGGGEYGKDWHKAGTQTQKQNVFDDFIAAAEHLIDANYTSSDYLAIRGGSNGGLLVGAVMLQRPELFKVALPAVGVLDMLRYHKFTSGAGWAYDYGTSDQSKEMFEYLYGYSPLHNVKDGGQYPATLITTGDHDDRVVPAHSFKFAAELQAKQAGENPVLIRIETNAGHGAGTPVSKSIEQYADIFGFTLYNMGVKKL
ncbi:S9 family peptidase [Thalassotalea litorea]|uniref:prolyl oligopeptidase n=1 Tax=Thalassotalea litorea TaxID=2020715 RepID=A0A5R9IIG6_9GAMM|nr:prolyl oligopeptidase family serine peptidase [Thalassotalea litorea]TLU65340.1 S9 family peptidase [Thalassotalea litorea]